LADPDEAMAYLEAALEDGDQETIQLALRHVIGAQEADNDAIGVADMDEEQLQSSTSDQFWTLISERRRQQTISRAELAHRLERRDAAQQTLTPTVTPAIAEPRADYTTNDE
jgi:ribosome-binding protein aMBF1 (putative translation factor)